MPLASGYERAVPMANTYERKFQWAKAAELYKNRLQALSRSDLEARRELLERIGRCQFNAAMQCSDKKSFRVSISRAIGSYKQASLTASQSPRVRGYFYRCQGMIAFLQYWIDSTPRLKMKSLVIAWQNAKSSLGSFEALENTEEFANSFNQLSPAAALLAYYEPDFKIRSKIAREAVDYGRRAVAELKGRRDRVELTRALAKTALFLDDFPDAVASGAQQKEVDQEAQMYWKSAFQRSRRIALEQLGCPPRGFYRIFDEQEGESLCENALRQAKQTRDNFSIGWLLSSLAQRLFWKAERTVDNAESTRLAKQSLALAEKSVEVHERIGFLSPNGGILWAGSPYAEHFLELTWFESDPQRRRLLGQKALNSTPELIRTAEKSGVPEIVHYAHHVTSKCKMEFAESETRVANKIALLKSALKHRRLAIASAARFEAPNSWNQGVGFRYLSDILTNLSFLEKDPEARRILLTDAVEQKKKGVEMSSNFVQAMDKSESHLLRAPLGKYYLEYGDALLRLYEITKNVEELRKAALAQVTASEWYDNTGMHNGQANSYWKAARTYEKLRAHLIAAENFDHASMACRAAAKATRPPMQQFWDDLSMYMAAWNEIERARYCHSRFEFSVSSRHYHEAAELHKSTKNWDFLAPYYHALAELEIAEDFSKNGSAPDAIGALHSAARLFGESKSLFRNRIQYIDVPEERQMIARLVNAPREDYCAARILLEEARSAEATGDYLTSSEKFALATQKLELVNKISDSIEDKKEAALLGTLSSAWELLTRAEVQSSGQLLEEACGRLEEARKLCDTSHSANLLSGHVYYCKALIASWKFAETLDLKLYQEANRDFDNAANHYLESGFKVAAQSATARRLLLNAYSQIDSGSRSEDARKKASAYDSAEALLREALEMFNATGQLERKNRVLRLLAKTRADWDRAAMLRQMASALPHGSANVAFYSFSRGGEEAVGLERLDKADIQLKVTPASTFGRAAGPTDVEIHIINPGRRAFRVVRIDDLIPEGAELGGVSNQFRRQGRSLIATQEVKIGAQKGETMQFSIWPKDQALLVITPRLILSDEKGTLQPRTVRPTIIAVSPIMRFLCSAYASDSASRQLAPSHCGWRSLMETVKAAKIPRSHVYGEPRYGRTFGKQLDRLIDQALVESKVFLGERGRGGEITKLRAFYDNEVVKQHIDELTRDDQITMAPPAHLA